MLIRGLELFGLGAGLTTAEFIRISLYVFGVAVLRLLSARFGLESGLATAEFHVSCF